ncbi:MAG: hypothetical protein EA422_04890 [Gemmatimonadales bacterium]|nr:MAG: hypothetical protein EA422_04890 [Gemmatimonadales bacterium]
MALGLLLLLLLPLVPAGGLSPFPGSVAAQEPVPELRGRLYVDSIPADSGTVILHRVNPEEAGPVDSVRVASGGEFTFPILMVPAPGTGEILFVSSRREGIVYFGDPISEAAHLDSLYVVRTFDTREAPEGGLPFTVALRGLFVDQGPMGWRVTDLIQIRNDSSVTWVSGEETDYPVWQYPVPPEARGLRVGRSDLAPEAVRFQDGVVQVRSPVPPGEQLYAIQYELDVLNFSIPMPGVTELMEIFVADEAPSLQMPPLMFDQPVELEPGSLYRRWVGEGLTQLVVRVEPGQDDEGGALVWVVVGLAVVLLGVGVWAVGRRGPDLPPSPSPSAAADSPRAAAHRRREVLLEIARLDDSVEGRDALPPEEARAYEARRSELMDELRLLGAASTGEDAEPAGRGAGPKSPGDR